MKKKIHSFICICPSMPSFSWTHSIRIHFFGHYCELFLNLRFQFHLRQWWISVFVFKWHICNYWFPFLLISLLGKKCFFLLTTDANKAAGGHISKVTICGARISRSPCMVPCSSGPCTVDLNCTLLVFICHCLMLIIFNCLSWLSTRKQIY